MHDFEDLLIETMYIPGARDAAEQFCERIFASSRWLGHQPRLCNPLQMPPDTTSIVTVTYLDSDGVRQSIDADDYALDPDTGLLTPVSSWPTGSEPRITFWAGADFDGSPPATLPTSLLCAMLELLGDLYSNREAQVVGTIMTINQKTQSMLWPFRTGLGM